MFDNEIDWVTRLERRSRCNCREADESGHADSKRRIHTRPSTCKELQQGESSGKCSSKKSVFRSAARLRASGNELFSGGFIRRLTLIRTEAIRLPALELILWSSY